MIVTILLLFLPGMLYADNKVTFLYSHGLANNKNQVYDYTKTYKENNIKKKNPFYLIDGPFHTFNYPDAHGVIAKWCRVNFTQTSFGQHNELSCLQKAYEKALHSAEESEDLIIVSLSRGAVVACHFLALYQPKHVKLAILESTFDSLESVLEKRFTSSASRAMAHAFLNCHMPFFKYKRIGIKPIQVADKINKDQPILFVCSQEDTTVPAECTINVYKKLRNLGYQHVYLLVLKHGKHAKLINGPEGQMYQDVVHALYKRYDLPHEATFAERGQEVLATCQPAL